MNKLIIVGAGGHGKVVADAAFAMQKWEKICFLDNHETSCNGRLVIGEFSDLSSELKKDFADVVVAVGDNYMRAELLLKIKKLGFNLPVVVHPYSWISGFAEIEAGSFISAGVVINANAKVGFGSIINTSAVIEHDCIIDEYVHISPNVALAGKVVVGKNSWIGVGANVIEGMQIGKNVIIGAGSVVINNIIDNVVVVGVPAKIIKNR